MAYIGNTIRAADDYRLIDDISSGFNGNATTFALNVAGSSPVPFPKSPQQVLISVNGVIQEPDPTGASGFNLVGTNIVFSSAPTNGHAFFGIIYATADYLNSGGNFPSGSTGSPSLTFIGDEDTGIYRKGSGSIGFVSNSTEIANTDSNGITISSGNLILGDSSGSSDDRIKLGASGDLEIYHDGSNSYVVDQGTGGLIIQGSQTSIRNTSGHIQINANDDVVELYYDNAKKLQTTANGIELPNNQSIFLGGKIDMTDSASTSTGRILLGTGDDLSIYHNGTDSVIDNITGELQILTDGIMRLNASEYKFNNAANSEKIANFFEDGACELYFNHAKKFETTSDGVSVTGTLTTDKATFTDDGSGEPIVHIRTDDANPWAFVINNDNSSSDTTSGLKWYVQNGGDGIHQIRGSSAFKNYFMTTSNGSTSENALAINTSRGVDLYYQNSKKLETTTGGISVTGSVVCDGVTLGDNEIIQLGNSSDLRIYHDSGANYVGTFTAQSLVFFTNNGSRWFIDATGHFLPITDNLYDLGSATKRVRNLYTTDLKLSNEGSQNDVDATWGNYTIQEGHEDLFLINHRTGKKFKFNLTEVA